jgi:hypothetical protein
VKTCTLIVNLALAIGAAATATASPALAQGETTASAACRLHNNLYTCNRAAFQRVLSNAKTVAIETGATDAIGQQKLRALVTEMGKVLVPLNQHADITLLLVPVDPAGVEYNTDNAQLATFRVFAANPGHSGRGDLVWAENYNGDIDLQWPQIINQVLSTFRSRFNIKG